MTCACKSIHRFPCLFPGETDFFPFDGREWCRFHLPLKDADGNKSDKGRGDNGWEEGGAELQAFTTEIHVRLRSATPVVIDWQRSVETWDAALLLGVVFPHDFNFSHITDTLHVSFSGATFGDRAIFTGVTFGAATSFGGANFGVEANFNDAIFGISASFFGTTFSGGCNFRGAKFGAGASFNNATFDFVFFNGATFGDRSYFDRTTFGNIASFNNATFGIWARFANATFSKSINCNAATFGDNACFSGTTFEDNVYFGNVTFLGAANFSASKAGNSKFDFRHVYFPKATFNGHCSFVNRAFATGADFNGAVFRDLVEFHGCKFHPGMSFHKTEFHKTKGDNDDATEALERSYRTLKLEMEKLRARNEEADFFALEMECRRQRGSVPWFERLAATAYKHLSDYGRSIAKPLVWMGFLLGYGFAYFYHLAQAKSFRAPGHILRFVMEQIVIPFTIWRNEYKCDPWMVDYLKEHPLLLRAPATLMSLTAIALIALFLLALRRRFKMD